MTTEIWKATEFGAVPGEDSTLAMQALAATACIYMGKKPRDFLLIIDGDNQMYRMAETWEWPNISFPGKILIKDFDLDFSLRTDCQEQA